MKALVLSGGSGTHLRPFNHSDPALVRSAPDHKGHLRYALDDSRVREELGYAPQVDFETGIAAVVEWYRENPDRWQPTAPPRQRAAMRSGAA